MHSRADRRHRVGTARRLAGWLVLPVPAIAGLVWIGVALAAATGPVKGAIYEGMLGNSSSQGGPVQETLVVSADGRKIASVVMAPVECGLPSGSGPPTIRNVRIVNGSFTAKLPSPATMPGVFDDATLTGHFLAHGRVTGQENVRSNDTVNGSLCKYSLPMTASAQPAGTKQCPNHAHAGTVFSSILVDGTTCGVVDKAADRGTFTQPGGPTSTKHFSTPGWTCRILTSGVDNHRCSRAHPKATFAFATV